jgi:hypothetical protein
MFFFTTTTLDLTSAPRVTKVKGWHISAGGVASTVVLLNGGVGGPIIAEIKVPAGERASRPWTRPSPRPPKRGAESSPSAYLRTLPRERETL